MSAWVEIRALRPADCPLPPDAKGLTGLIDGKPAVVVGLHRWHGQLWLFFEIKDERARRPHFLHRQAKKLLSQLKTGGESVYVQRSFKEPNSARWLARLGFMRTGFKHLNYEVWQWQP